MLVAAAAAVAAAQTRPDRASACRSTRPFGMAVENNRQLQTARLQVEKADADLAAARTRRLPVFETEVTRIAAVDARSDFAFPQGAFGDFPGTGPIPATDTTVSVPRQPTMYVSSQVSQPLSQLFRIGLGIRSAAATRDIERERAAGAGAVGRQQREAAVLRASCRRESALAATDEAIALYRELDRTLEVRVAQKVALRADALDVQFRLAQEELRARRRGRTRWPRRRSS